MMAAKGVVIAGGESDAWESDESSFYGDEEEKALWESRVGESDEEEHWAAQRNLNVVVASKSRRTAIVSLDGNEGGHARTKGLNTGGKTTPSVSDQDTCKAAGSSAERHELSVTTSTTLHNPLEGRKNAKQLHESAADFVKRAPPLDSLWSDDGWLWVANPYAEQRKHEPDHEVFTAIGRQYLDNYLEQRQQLESKHPDKTAGVITRMLKPTRDKLKADIEQLAITNRLTSGKWLLFPRVEDVPSTWRTVVEAVTENRLGNLAKVATGSDKREDDGVRVICVYTADFTNESEVHRVCRGLNDLGLIPADRSIWYKADAYTELGISRDNKYNIPPTSYSSKDVLAKGDLSKGQKRGAPSLAAAKEPAKKKQATLDWSF